VTLFLNSLLRTVVSWLIVAKRVSVAVLGWLDRHGLPSVSSLLTIPLGFLAIASLHYAFRLRELYRTVCEKHEAVRELYITTGVPGMLVLLWIILAICMLVFLAGLTLGRRRTAGTLSFLRKCYITAYGLFFALGYGVSHVTALLENNNVKIDGTETNNVLVFFWRWALLWPAGCLFIAVALLHLVSWRRCAIRHYAGEGAAEPAPGDWLLENLRTHGHDPKYRRSLLSSTSLHLLIIVIIPWLLQYVGCIAPYRVPEGSGDPVVTLVKMVKPKKKEKKKYILRPDSAIYFDIPDLDESKILEEVKEQTELVYVTDPNRVHGKMGQGGGKEGGWPDGMGREPVRFIRLEYRGQEWDDGMAANERADVNFLEAFRRRTGFSVTTRPESHGIYLLTKYPKGFAPPFVYMTGDSAISVSRRDMKILRDYLLDGGMLFADAGSARWDTNFRTFMKAVFPDKPLLDIADDDPLYLFPYAFANGAPPLWHHGGNRAMGVKHRGRWCVFYHPGDVNDAWKTGHSGLDPELAEAAFDLGTNIIYYAFTHYLQETRKYRK